MQIFILNPTEQILVSVLFGILSGLIYDFLCVIPYALKREKKYSFICDFAFMVILTIFIFAITFDKNDGAYRLYIFATLFSAFVLYRLTIGRALKMLELKIFRLIFKILDYTTSKLHNLLDIFVKFVKIKAECYILMLNNKFAIRRSNGKDRKKSKNQSKLLD